MIIVDTNIWVTHFRSPIPALFKMLDDEYVYCHPFVLGELVSGSIANREGIIAELGEIFEPPVGRTEEFLAFVETRKLFSRGIGFVDCHLLLSAVLSGDSKIWTNDKRLKAVSIEMGLNFDDPVTRLN